MKRSAFTMIELMFVIVILGILAAIAVTKLSVTRDDAEISKLSTNLTILISDVGSTYTSKGLLNTWKQATNINLMLDATTSIIDTTSVTDTVYIYSGSNQCLSLVSTTEGNLTISNGSDTTGTICKAIQSLNSDKITSHIFGGSIIKY